MQSVYFFFLLSSCLYSSEISAFLKMQNMILIAVLENVLLFFYFFIFPELKGIQHNPKVHLGQSIWHWAGLINDRPG